MNKRSRMARGLLFQERVNSGFVRPTMTNRISLDLTHVLCEHERCCLPP
jgi:hypothetical protein